MVKTKISPMDTMKVNMSIQIRDLTHIWVPHPPNGVDHVAEVVVDVQGVDAEVAVEDSILIIVAVSSIINRDATMESASQPDTKTIHQPSLSKI